jgi:hypothetical protein
MNMFGVRLLVHVLRVVRVEGEREREREREPRWRNRFAIERDTDL